MHFFKMIYIYFDNINNSIKLKMTLSNYDKDFIYNYDQNSNNIHKKWKKPFEL